MGHVLCKCFPDAYLVEKNPISIYSWESMSQLDLGASLVAQSVESACNAEDLGSIPRVGRSPEEGNGDPLQYSCMENPMDRGAWQGYSLLGGKSQTQLSN